MKCHDNAQQELADDSKKESSNAQSKLNDKFVKIKDALEELRAQNKTLSKPLTVPETQKEEVKVKQTKPEFLKRIIMNIRHNLS